MSAKTLYLLRHAKSDWDDPNLSDHNRPLSARGQRAAPLIAEALRQRAITPDLILCSTAMRARQTLALVKPALGQAPVQERSALYTFDHASLALSLQEITEDIRSVLVIGHNPALQDLALMLCATPEQLPSAQAALVDKMANKFPTASFAALRLSGPWATVSQQRGQATPLAFLRPKELKKSEDHS